MERTKIGIWGVGGLGLIAVLLALACAVMFASASAPSAYADQGELKAGTVVKAQAASKTCALYTAKNELVPCTATGKQAGTSWSVNAYKKVKTLYIASDVKTVTNEPERDVKFTRKNSSESYIGHLYHAMPLTKVVFLTDSNGVNACTSIPAETFDDTSIKTVSNFEKTKVRTIGANAFCDSDLRSISLPPTLKSIGGGAFWANASLKTVNGLNKTKVTAISDGTFEDCEALTSISLPSTCKTIGKEAFGGCTSLKKASLGKNLSSIGYSAFQSCYKLTSINLPAKVKSLKPLAFAYCESLKSVALRSASLVKLNRATSKYKGDSFLGTPIANSSAKSSIKVPKKLLSKYRASSAWRAYRSKFRAL